MEETRQKKKSHKDEKRFEIRNIDLLREGKVKFNKKTKEFGVLGIKGTFLRIERNNLVSPPTVKMKNKKNWQPEYQALFLGLKDPWNDKLEDLQGNLSGTCSEIHQKVCHFLNKRCKNNKCKKSKKKKVKKLKKKKIKQKKILIKKKQNKML